MFSLHLVSYNQYQLIYLFSEAYKDPKPRSFVQLAATLLSDLEL